VGYLDEEFTAFYVWDDYCLRAEKAGMVNAVIGVDLSHQKIGRGGASNFYVPSISKHDLGRLHTKHGATF